MTETAREIADGIMEASFGHGWQIWPTHVSHRDAIESALLAAERRGVKVKMLEWVSRPGATDYAESVLGEWAAWDFDGDRGHYMPPGEPSGRPVEGGLDAAKAAAQADYEARILSALVSSPAPEGDAETIAMFDRAVDIGKARVILKTTAQRLQASHGDEADIAAAYREINHAIRLITPPAFRDPPTTATEPPTPAGRPPESVIAEKDRDISRMQATITEACARIAELERENAWLIECNGRSSVRAERAEDKAEVDERLRNQAQEDAGEFLLRAEKAEAALAELRGVALQWQDRSDRPGLRFAGATIMSILSPEGEAKGEDQPPRDADPVPANGITVGGMHLTVDFVHRETAIREMIAALDIVWRDVPLNEHADAYVAVSGARIAARSAGITQGGPDV